MPNTISLNIKCTNSSGNNLVLLTAFNELQEVEGRAPPRPLIWLQWIWTRLLLNASRSLTMRAAQPPTPQPPPPLLPPTMPPVQLLDMKNPLLLSLHVSRLHRPSPKKRPTSFFIERFVFESKFLIRNYVVSYKYSMK